MKTFLVGLFLVLFAIVSLPLYLMEFIIGKFSRRRQAAAAQAIVSRAFRFILFFVGAKITVKGKERIPKDQAVLFVSNHRSYFDILTVYTTTPHLTGFIAKKEMAHIPCISHWMRYMHCLFLDRDNIREGMKTILQAIEYVKEGYSIHIAPEGTRNQGTEMLPFKEGSFKIAEKTGCPVIPVALSNTDALFERQIPWVRGGHVIIEYGDPIYPGELSREDRKHLGTLTRDIIAEMLDRNEKEV